MSNLEKIAKERIAFDERFYSQEKQIIILTPYSCGGAGRSGSDLLWTASQFFIAYIDCDSDELITVNDRVEWLITDQQSQEGTSPFKFSPLSMYKLKVRPAKPAKPEDYQFILDNNKDFILPDLQHKFMLLDIVSDTIDDERLQHVLDEYKTPVFLQDETIGELELDKDLDLFSGFISWLDKEIHICIEGADNAQHKLAQLKSFLSQADVWDKKLRDFSAKQLTELANDWQQEDEENNATTITEKSFAKRISLSELSISDDNKFVAYYDDDDMFFGHIIVIDGMLDGTLKDAYIAG